MVLQLWAVCSTGSYPLCPSSSCLLLLSTQENCFDLGSGFTGRSDHQISWPLTAVFRLRMELVLKNCKASVWLALSWLRMDISVVHLWETWSSVGPVIYCTGFLYSWDRASPDIELLFMSNEMQLFMFFITNEALHVSGVLRPSSGALWTVQCRLW
jgi:hypothetical protein